MTNAKELVNIRVAAMEHQERVNALDRNFVSIKRVTNRKNGEVSYYGRDENGLTYALSYDDYMRELAHVGDIEPTITSNRVLIKIEYTL